MLSHARGAFSGQLIVARQDRLADASFSPDRASLPSGLHSALPDQAGVPEQDDVASSCMRSSSPTMPDVHDSRSTRPSFVHRTRLPPNRTIRSSPLFNVTMSLVNVAFPPMSLTVRLASTCMISVNIPRGGEASRRRTAPTSASADRPALLGRTCSCAPLPRTCL